MFDLEDELCFSFNYVSELIEEEVFTEDVVRSEKMIFKTFSNFFCNFDYLVHYIFNLPKLYEIILIFVGC